MVFEISLARRPAGHSKSERLQKFHQVQLFLGSESQGRTAVVMVHDVAECRKTPIMIEASLLVTPDSCQGRSPIHVRRRTVGLERIHANLTGSVQVVSWLRVERRYVTNRKRVESTCKPVCRQVGGPLHLYPIRRRNNRPPGPQNAFHRRHIHAEQVRYRLQIGRKRHDRSDIQVTVGPAIQTVSDAWGKRVVYRRVAEGALDPQRT